MECIIVKWKDVRRKRGLLYLFQNNQSVILSYEGAYVSLSDNNNENNNYFEILYNSTPSPTRSRNYKEK
jgi:hypothetical protein